MKPVFPGAGKLTWLFFALLVLGGIFPGLPGDVAAAEQLFSFQSPAEGAELHNKRPRIQVITRVPATPGNLFVLLDGTDITGALDQTSEGFEFHPPQPLAAGEHELYVFLFAAAGQEQEGRLHFSTSYPGLFDQSRGSADLSAAYNNKLDARGSLDNAAQQDVNANLAIDSEGNRGNWSVGLTTNLRYIDRSQPVFRPEKKGIDLVNYKLSGRYSNEETDFLAETGDLQLQQSPNTVSNLARRGAHVNLRHQVLNLDSFLVTSRQLLGSEGTGLRFEEGESIRGASAGLSLFDNRFDAKVIYVKGGESGSSFGYYTSGVEQQGDVLGMVLEGRLIDGRLNLNGEYDLASFDDDTSDEFKSADDRAWRLGASGYSGDYSYALSYDYTGPDYQVIGNQGLQRDRQGGSLQAGLRKQSFGLTLNLSNYQDNVDDSPALSQTMTTQGGVQLDINRFVSLPLGFSYQKSVLNTTRVSAFGMPMLIHTDVFGARANYLAGDWNIGFNSQLSLQNDKTTGGRDSRLQTYSLAPVYYSEHFSFSPNLSFNRSTDLSSAIDTDTYTFNLDLRGDLFAHLVSYEFGGAFNRTESSDDLQKFDSLNSRGRISLQPRKPWGDFLNPSIGLSGQYNRSNNRLTHTDNDEFLLLLAVTATMGYRF